MFTTRIRALGLAGALCATLAAQEDIPADTEIQETDSGLKYSVLEEGSGGRTPKAHEQVRVHYSGWLTDGTPFDSSRERGEPSVFPLNGVIAGWTEGLQLMTPGARYKFTIPWELAYGERGRGSIPPKADLIFDVELLDVQPEMPAINDDEAVTTESGLRYQVLTEGAGAGYEDGMLFEFEFAWFREDGGLQEGTWKNGIHLPKHIVDRAQFVREVGAVMKPGAEVFCEVPAGLGLTPNAEFWTLKLVGFKEPMKVPEFGVPPDEELQKTASGLRYKVIDKGGPDRTVPKMGETVRVHYAGRLTDGKLFDSSFERGEPAEFALGRVIPGWNEGLQLMTPGAKYVFVIPSELGYGARGYPPDIPPNATLVFWIELISVER